METLWTQISFVSRYAQKIIEWDILTDFSNTVLTAYCEEKAQSAASMTNVKT